MKKKPVRSGGGIAFFCIAAAFLVWFFLLREPKEYLEYFPDQVGVSDEVFEHLLSDYEDSFDTLISSLTAHMEETGMSYDIWVYKRGYIDMPKELRRDAGLAAAIRDIHSDDLFRTNPLIILANKYPDGAVCISILLRASENSSVSIMYQEPDREPIHNVMVLEERIRNSNWFVHVFMGI